MGEGIKYCRNCGNQLNKDAKFCRYCGYQFTAEEKSDAPKIEFCRNCGKEIPSEVKFCRFCGYSFLSAESRPSVQTKPQDRMERGYGQDGRTAWQERPVHSSQVLRRSPMKAVVPAVLVLAVFVSFVYPGFIRTRLFGGGSGQGNDSMILTPPEKDPDKINAGNSGNGNQQYDDELPTPEELEAEYAKIDAAYENGTLFENLTAKSDPHPEYNWLYNSEGGWDVSDDSEDAEKQQPKILPCGTSKAFRMETPYGVTISAGENALDKDRTFSLESVSGEQIEQLEEVFVNDIEGPGMILDAWELDAGLKDDEAFSEYFTLELDLNQMGVTEEDYPILHFYRVDDSGTWFEYASEIEGNKAIIHSNQNSIILTALALGELVRVSLPLVDKWVGWQSGAYVYPWTGAFPIYYKGAPVIKIFLDRNQFKDILLNKSADYIQELNDKVEYQAFKETVEKYHLEKNNFTESAQIRDLTRKMKKDPNKVGEANEIWNSFSKRYQQLYKENIENDPDYLRVQANLEAYNKAIKEKKKVPPEIEQVEKVCENAVRAWGWLKEELKVKMPKYQLRIDLSGETRGSYGVTIPKYKGNPYIVIFMEMLGSGTKLAYDRLLCTLCHEMFHVVQRGFAWDSMANYKFDEMSAQDVEEMAFDYFQKAETDPITSSKEAVMENLMDKWYFALPLNDFSTTYPEGTISVSGTKKPDASYPVAPLLTYLRESYVKPQKTYPVILDTYGSLWRRGKVTEILKAAFELGDNEEKLTDAYLKFAKKNQPEFYKEALKPEVNTVFSPVAEVEGKTDIKLLNKNYTIRVRRAQPKKLVKEGEEYALVLKYNDNYAKLMTDFYIEPLNMKRDKDYKSYRDGIFIEPRKASEKETVYLMEADGGTGTVTEGKIWNGESSGYSLYLMVKPKQPEVEVKGDILELKLPKLGEEPEKEIVDRYVVTIRTGKTEVLRDFCTRREVKDSAEEPYQIFIGDLKINGRELTDDEKKDLVLVIQECVEDTYETKRPCLGPECDPVSLSMQKSGDAAEYIVRFVPDWEYFGGKEKRPGDRDEYFIQYALGQLGSGTVTLKDGIYHIDVSTSGQTYENYTVKELYIKGDAEHRGDPNALPLSAGYTVVQMWERPGYGTRYEYTFTFTSKDRCDFFYDDEKNAGVWMCYGDYQAARREFSTKDGHLINEDISSFSNSMYVCAYFK